MRGSSPQTNELIEKNNKLAAAAEKQAAAAEIQAKALGETRRQENIHAAIEASHKNMEDPRINEMKLNFYAMIDDKNGPTGATFARNRSASVYVSYLNYMAQLINNDQLDFAYVDDIMRCQIYNMHAATNVPDGLQNRYPARG